MEDPPSGVQLGLKIFTFPEKAVPDMKKWVPRQALEKGVYLEGVKTLKMITLPALLLVFMWPGAPKKDPKSKRKWTRIAPRA